MTPAFGWFRRDSVSDALRAALIWAWSAAFCMEITAPVNCITRCS